MYSPLEPLFWLFSIYFVAASILAFFIPGHLTIGRIKNLGLNGCVRIINNVHDMPALYSLVDIVISASVRPEAFGRVAIEAQVAWQKGQEAGLKRIGQASLRGLIPSRLAAARDAFRRAGGR